MRTAFVATGLALLIAVTATVAALADEAQPVVLVFEADKGDGADRELAASTTRAIRTYLRETRRIESTVFNRESPTVLRAIMDKKLTADQVASYTSREQRLEVAKILAYDYAAGAEVAVKEGVVQVKLWLGKVGGGRGDSWEATGSALSGGAGDRDLDNAMQSASSAAVRDIERQALTGSARSARPLQPTEAATTAISTAETPQTSQPTASDYEAKGDESAKSGNYALAVQYYSQAVSADPAEPSLRIKLAEAYANKGLFREAQEELGRATMVGASPETVAAAKQRIEQLQSGQGAPAATVPTESPAETSPAPTTSPAPEAETEPADGPAAAIAKMIEGDKLWNQGKPDEAAEAYKEASRLNPADWRTWERLAVVSASISLFTESRKALEGLAKVQPEPPAPTVANRYEIFRKAFDRHFNNLLRQYDSAAADYGKGTVTRESYYNSIKGLAARLEAMARFLDVLVIPSAKEPAHLRRGLACGLMAQAATSLLDFLETNSEQSRADAEVFAAQAKKETAAAATLEANKVVVEKEPAGPAE